MNSSDSSGPQLPTGYANGIGALRHAVSKHDRGRGIPVGEFERRAIAFLRDHDFPPYLRN